MYNNKYTKAIEIAARIARRYKTRHIDKNNIVEWCAACTFEEIKTAPEWFLHEGVELDVNSDKQALMPCNVYRLLDIYDSDENRVYAYDNGTYITLDDESTLSKVYINYYGMPLDENGMPLIVKGSESACEYYCLIQLFEEDYAMGKITENVWQYYQRQLEKYVDKARVLLRHKSRNDIQVMLSIVGDMTPQLGRIGLYNLD